MKLKPLVMHTNLIQPFPQQPQSNNYPATRTMLLSRHKTYQRSTPWKSVLWNRPVLLLLGFGLVQNLTIPWSLTKSELNNQGQQGDIDVKYKNICSCVNCDEDEVCGGLWRASYYPDMPSVREVFQKKIHIVVSHCKKPLSWMPMYLEGFTNIASIHVISKCGVQVEGAPKGAIVKVLPKNVGRNDHSFAYYITSILPKIASPVVDTSVVVFLKDTISNKIHQGREFRQLDLKSLIRIASSLNGFACGLGVVGGKISAYHDKIVLSSMRMISYGKGDRDYKTGDGVPFVGLYETLGDFYNSLNATSSPDVVEVCYGGIFAASTANIFTMQDMKTWKALEKALERGDNIQEGHYAERSWARLLATPLKPFQVKAIKNYATGVHERHGSLHGTLIREAGDTERTFIN